MLYGNTYNNGFNVGAFGCQGSEWSWCDTKLQVQQKDLKRQHDLHGDGIPRVVLKYSSCYGPVDL